MGNKEKITDPQDRITVTPESSITVKLEDSKGSLDQVFRCVGLAISIFTLIGVTLTQCSTVQLAEKVEENEQFSDYIEKMDNIITKNETIEVIDNRPSLAFKLKDIKQMDHLTRSYTRKLNQESRRIILIYLYESDLINHSKATGLEFTGQEGICKIKDYEEKIEKGNKLIKSKEVNKNEYPYCNLSTNRYYFNDIDMSGIFLKNIKLHNSYLNRTNFTGAKLMGADLRNSGLREANFTKARLKRVDFSSPYSGDPTALYGANFTGADLTEANFTNTDLRDAVFGDNKCTDENKRKDFEKHKKPTLNCANLDKANLTGAENIDIDEIKKAYNWRTAKYDQETKKKLGL
ncbi:MAG: pentapeptide repeat-containing protein [Crocosphaera sp.]